MTDDIEEIELPNDWPSKSTCDAECLNCGYRDRFHSPEEEQSEVGETFQHQCLGCGDGICPGLANVQEFRIGVVDPEDDAWLTEHRPDPPEPFHS